MTEKKSTGHQDLFSQFDPAQMVQQFQDMVANSPFKQFDTQGIVDAQVKNFETLQRMNETAMTGAQSLFERHAQMMQQAMQEAGEAVKKLGETQPQDLANENIRVLEGAMQKSMENFSEISEMAQGVYSEVGQQMEERIEQSMQELKDTIEKVSQNKP